MALLPCPGAIGDAPPLSLDPLPMECSFQVDPRTRFVLDPASATVRRVDVRPVRHGRLHVTAEEFRFVFVSAQGGVRIELVIDRANGNARRVAGTPERMTRIPDDVDPTTGLVYEAGQCRSLQERP